MQRNGKPVGQRVESHPAGSVLVVVLVVLAVLALGAYTFSEFMIVEAQATSAYAHEAQARAAADSGIELVCSLLTQRYEQTPQSYFSNPEWFKGVTIHDSESAKSRGRFSVVSAVENDPSGRTIRFGLTDESSKLNINAIPKLITDNTQARMALQYIPDMTPDLADAILDWVDTDQTNRELGAEDETYASMGYKARNAAIDSLDELLLVRGVTPWLLFGEDANRNGLLDPNENDGDLSPPSDNADGILNRGWSAYLTVQGREGNYKADGTQRINVNMNSLADLYDQVQPILGDQAATFLVAYRVAGPTSTSSSGGSGNSAGGGSTAGGSSGGSSGSRSTASTGGSGGGGSTAGASGGATQPTAAGGGASTSGAGGGASGAAAGSTSGQSSGGVTQAASAVGSAASMTPGGTVTRGGINVTNGGSNKLTSLYQLVDAQVKTTVNGMNTTLTSPWTSDPSSLRSTFPLLLDAVSVKSGQYIEGRVNVNQARSEVLTGILMAGVSGFNPSIIDAIVTAQATASSGSDMDRMTTAWLLINGIVDLPTLQKIDPFLTARGDVFRLQSVGYFDEGGPSARIEAVIDATVDPPTVAFMRDLTDLGRGFSPQLLTTGAGGTQ